MNILILSWRSPGHPNAGGAEAVTFEHAKAWVKAGHQVVWFSSEFKGGKVQEVKDGIIIIRRGDYILGVRLQALIWYFFGKHPKFDLIVDEFHGLPFFTPLFVRARKLAFIHEVAREVWKYNPWPEPFNLLPSVLGTIFEPWIFRVFYKNVPFMTVSNSTKNDLINWGISRGSITVINNGVSLILPRQLPAKEAKKTVLFLGAISEDKGTFDAVRIFGEIERKDDAWQYWIVGYGTAENVKKIKNLAREIGISDKMKYWGYVNDKKKFELLARAHVLVNPSVHEGWGLVNIEANSVGTPVVGYNVHGLRDSVKNEKTGILVSKGDFRKLAEEILNLVRNKEKYESMQKNAIKWSKAFSWDKSVRKSVELIENL